MTRARRPAAGEPGSVTPAEALALILAHTRPLGRETVAVEAALGRRLAAPVRAPRESPPFDQSAMDGFAVRSADLAAAAADRPVRLRLAGSMPAGAARVLRLGRAAAVKVFTGGRLPRGADSVVMIEDAEAAGDEVVFRAPASPGLNLRRRGEEFARGAAVLPSGARITPPVIGLLALLGRTEVAVGRLPAVTLVTMGDEVVPAGERLRAGCVHDANGPALAAALRASGVRRLDRRHVGDRLPALVSCLEAALRRSDLVITVGGASVGDHDHAAEARRRLGVREIFRRVAVRPGKPNLFGLAPCGTPVFSLPGNPVSALVSFHQLVKPLLAAQAGAPAPARPTLPVRLAEGVADPGDRTAWLRARRLAAEGVPLAGVAAQQGSHMLSALAEADLLVEIPAASAGACAGDTVAAHPLDWWG